MVLLSRGAEDLCLFDCWDVFWVDEELYVAMMIFFIWWLLSSVRCCSLLLSQSVLLRCFLSRRRPLWWNDDLFYSMVAVLVALLFSSPLSVCISVSSLPHFLSLPSDHADLIVLILFRHLGFFLFYVFLFYVYVSVSCLSTYNLCS